MPWQPGQKLEDVEKEVILKALSFYQGNKAQTARSLGIAPNTLAAKLDQYSGKVVADEVAAKAVAPAPTKKGKSTQ